MSKPRRQPRPPTPIDPTTPPRPTTPTPDLRRLLLDHLNTLKIAPVGQTLDALLTQAEQEGWSHLEFAHRLLGGLANERHERSIERRIYEAGFGEICLLEQFDSLGDAPLAMAFLDRLVDRAIILKIKGKSYRASPSIKSPSPSQD